MSHVLLVISMVKLKHAKPERHLIVDRKGILIMYIIHMREQDGFEHMLK